MMDYNQYGNHQYNNGDGQYPLPQPSEKMELAAAVLGAIAVVCCVCWYVSIPCGALAIILANLSRGGRTEYTLRAQVAIFLGIAAVVLCVVVYAISIAVEIRQYGSFANWIDAYSNLTGISYEDLLEQLYQ